ncbi:MAG: protein kinase [Muribaculaceae bacterium]|nr:protein kinase [Muribaculaceae bacterium]
MMNSEFSTRQPFHEEGEKIPAATTSSGHYRFYKVRLYGTLHFVKTPAEAFSSDLLTREALRKEFMIGYSLNHPSIVRYMRFDDNALYEEYIDGVTLREMIDNGDPRLRSPRFVDSVARQLLEGVEYMHRQGVLHLDLKPENVMITRIGNRVKIIDLGCAYSDSNDSTPGFTLSYRAPEQENAPTNCYTDIYLTGRIIAELARAAGDTRRWRRFLRKATAENPRDRFASDRDAIAALPPSRTRVVRIAAAAVAVMSIIVTMIMFMKPVTPAVTLTRNDSLVIINQDIETFIADYYEKNIYPLSDPGINYDLDRRAAFFDSIYLADIRIEIFKNRLMEQYPSFKSDIERQVYVLKNMQKEKVADMMDDNWRYSNSTFISPDEFPD